MTRSWLEPVRFDYAVSTGGLAAVRLLAEVDAALGPPSQAWLLVRRADLRARRAPYASETFIDQPLLWEVSFRLPLELFEYPRALFDLEARDRVAIALPAPELRADVAALVASGRKPRRRPLLRRSVVGLATGLALAAASDSLVGVASAASAPTHTANNGAASRTSRAATPRPALTSSPSTPTTLTTTTKIVTTTIVTHKPTRVPAKPMMGDSKPSAGCALMATIVPNPMTSETGRHAARPGTAIACVAPHKTKKKSRKHTPGNHAPRKAATPSPPPTGGAGLTSTRRPATLRRETGNNKTSRHRAPRTSSRAAATATPVRNSPWAAGFGIDPFTAAQIARFSTVSASLDQPPAFLIPIYEAAGRKYGISWQILAAINALETNYGQDLAVSPKGAFGWMQFMPATWAEFAMHVNGYGRPNPYDPRDAIFSAARLLAANGGARDIRRALFAYNHALWYVDAVLWRAALISDRGLDAHLGTRGYALPLDARYMAQLGRTDDGIDIEDAPDGVAVYSITPGIVTAVASDPSGFGPDYPVILVTGGPLAGQYIYYGHVAASLVAVGQHVVAGQPIAVMGHTGDAASLGHGHIEIGFSDGAGDPLNHHSGLAWTPSGAAMRTVLRALSSAFRLKTS